MKDKMTKRERVTATMNLQDTDRTPIYDIILNDAIIQYFTGRIPPTNEEGLKLKCQAIGKMLDMTRMASSRPVEGGMFTDEFGFVELMERWTLGGIIKRPFEDEDGAKEWIKKAIIALKNEIDEMNPKRISENYRADFLKIQNYIGDDTVVLNGETGTGLDEIRYRLGIELFSYIDADEPGLISEYLDLYTKKEVGIIHAIADPKLSPCALTFGDIAYKGSLLHSPQWLRKEFMPRLKRLNDAWHEHGIKCLFHSDGYYMDVIPDLISVGIDGLNPIETIAGMDLKEVKSKYGKKVFIAGSIDISQLLSYGTVEQVSEICTNAIDVASPGYFIGSTTELDNGSKLENILAMLEVVWGVKML